MRHQNSVSDEGIKESEALMTNGCCLIQSSQVHLDEDLNKLPKLGLKLSITPSLVDEVKQVMLKSGCSFNGEEQANNSSDANPVTETKPRDNIVQRASKQKAETFPISLLQIGSWQRVSRNDGDLVAKCYFSKRKLVWEFLEIDGLKRKIEIRWHEILSLRPFLLQGQYPGILEIELTHPPAMYHEMEPKPRKHTQWRVVSDFTEGLAPTYRRHYLEFPPGVLDAPLERILKTDNRLFQMSQHGFPILKSPYFSKYAFRDFSLVNINPQPQPQQQRSFGNVSTFFPRYEPAPLNSPASVVDSSEYGGNQMPLLEGQGGIINVGDNNLTADQIRGTMMPSAATSLPHVNSTTDQIRGTMMPSAAISLPRVNSTADQIRGTMMPSAATSLPQVNSTEPFENNYFPLPQNQLEGLVPMQQLSMMFQDDHQQNMILNNPLNEFANSITDDNIFLQEPFRNNMTSDVVSPTMMADNSVLMSNAFSNNGVGNGQMYPQVMNWPSDEHQFSSSINPNDFNHEITNWTHDFNPRPWQ